MWLMLCVGVKRSVWLMLCVGVKRSVCKELVEFVEGKESLGRIKPSWEGNMKKKMVALIILIIALQFDVSTSCNDSLR